MRNLFQFRLKWRNFVAAKVFTQTSKISNW